MRPTPFWKILSVLVLASLILAACGGAATTAPTQEEAAPATEAPAQPPETTEAATEAVTTEAAATKAVTTEPAATQAEAATTCTGEVVNIKMDDWSSADRSGAIKQVLDAFEAANPCIKVEFVASGGEEGRAKRMTQIEAGTSSDLIATTEADLPRYYLAGGLADLSEFISADPDFKPDEIFYESVWKTGWYDGKPLAIAKDFSVSAFYINTDLFDKAGIEIPQEGWTYDEYLDIVQQLTLDVNGNNAKSPDFDPENVAQWGTTIVYGPGESRIWWRGFQTFLYSMGTHTISPDGTTTQGYLNSEENVAAWEWYQDLAFTHYVSPSATTYDATKVGALDLFQDGKLAIAGNYWGPWFQDVFNEKPNLKWAVVPLPTGRSGHNAAIMWMGWGVSSKSEHPQEAWTLLKWLTTEPGQRVFAAKALSGDQRIAEEFQRADDPYWGVYMNEVQHQDVLDDTLNPRYPQCVDTPGGELMYRFLVEGSTLDIKTELDKFAEEADECLAEGQ
jgi:multiple sugar transport system substrate-binding protein